MKAKCQKCRYCIRIDMGEKVLCDRFLEPDIAYANNFIQRPNYCALYEKRKRKRKQK